MSYNSSWTGPQIDDAVGKALASAKQTDLTSIIATGSTNATGSTIASGTYFYLNGTLVRAKANIASGATFTSSNYEAVTAGGLNELKAAINIVGAKVPFCVPINSTTKVTITLSSYNCCVRAFATRGAGQSIDILYANGYLTKNIVGTFFDASVSSDNKIITITDTPGSGTGATYLAVNFYPTKASQTCVVQSVPR